jgi:hypothetical protein
MEIRKSFKITIIFAVVLLLLSACGIRSTSSSTTETTFSPLDSNGNTNQQQEEQYEPITTAEYEPNMELSGRIEWDADGLVNGGPVESFSFWGQQIELTSNMITNGMLSTKDYGDILIKANSNGSMHIELTPSQQQKIKLLKP